MALTAMWIHGNALIPEFPNSLESITRRGIGTEGEDTKDFGASYCCASQATLGFPSRGCIFLTATIVCKTIPDSLAATSAVLM